MRIKTFQAQTMQEALLLARQELGEDAVVLNTKHVKSGGLLGMGASSMVELMAAIDDNAQPVMAAAPVMQEAVAVAAQVSAPINTMPSFNAIAARMYAEEKSKTLSENNEVDALRGEVKQLSKLVQGLMNGGVLSKPSLSKPLISRLGIDDSLVETLLSDLAHIEDPEELTSALAGKLSAFALPPSNETGQVIAVVGPTGVGKTTTIAKIAAKYALEDGKSVAMITADTYRIGAVEQLKTYARIMGVPLEIALSPEEVSQAVAKHKDKDIILIDTVGRSQRNDEHLEELKSFVNAADPTEVYLVVSATLMPEIQKEVVEKFGVLSPSRLVISKIDESPNRGCLINLPFLTGMGITCITNGQNVPQDIDYADAGKIARYITEVY